jgi:hypothetical protein
VVAADVVADVVAADVVAADVVAADVVAGGEGAAAAEGMSCSWGGRILHSSQKGSDLLSSAVPVPVPADTSQKSCSAMLWLDRL